MLQLFIISRILELIYWTITIFSFDHMTDENRELGFLMPYYYPTALRRVQITPKTRANITRYLYSRGPVRQVSCC